MKITVRNQYLNLRMTDVEAEMVVKSLQDMLIRRKELIAAAPELENWNDVAVSSSGHIDDENNHCQISLSICGI